MDILGTLQTLWLESGFAAFFMAGGWKNLVMILIAFVLLYLGIAKKFEPLLLCGIAFGCLLSNLSYFVSLGDSNALYLPELHSSVFLWHFSGPCFSGSPVLRPHR